MFMGVCLYVCIYVNMVFIEVRGVGVFGVEVMGFWVLVVEFGIFGKVVRVYSYWVNDVGSLYEVVLLLFLWYWDSNSWRYRRSCRIDFVIYLLRFRKEKGGFFFYFGICEKYIRN